MSQSEATKRPAPNHIAIIMDGNGRWAQSRGLPRSAGHKAGVEAVRRAVKAAEKLDLKYLTLFGFSTENWNRPRAEIDALFDLLRRFVNSDLESLKARNVRIRILGARENLSADLKEIVERAENETRDNTGPVLSIAFNYGGRDEIVRAARRMADAAARGELNVETIVVGLPFELDDTEGRSARLARQIGQALEEATGMEVHFQDERYSTVVAEERLRAAGRRAAAARRRATRR